MDANRGEGPWGTVGKHSSVLIIIAPKLDNFNPSGKVPLFSFCHALTQFDSRLMYILDWVNFKR